MIRLNSSTCALLAGAALAVTPAAALAHKEVSDQAAKVADKAADLQAATNSLNDELTAEQRAAAERNAATTGAADRDDHDGDDDDDGGKWGWLGLLGLAGLLGLRRRDDHAHHDHRRDNDRTTTTTAAGTRTDSTRL